MIASTALLCMALSVYHEARGESVPGQYAVATVIRNRANANPDKVCQATFAPKQFSWANHGVKRTAAGWQIPARLIPTDEFAWWRAQRIAEVTLSGGMGVWMAGATHYHATRVSPKWSKAMMAEATIGRHRFYRLS